MMILLSALATNLPLAIGIIINQGIIGQMAGNMPHHRNGLDIIAYINACRYYSQSIYNPAMPD